MRIISTYTKIFAVVAATIFAANAGAKTLKKPAPLQPGDTIAIISMASTPDSSFVIEGAKALRSWGYIPVIGKHVLDAHGTFAGTEHDRLEDMRWAYETPGIKAVMSSRGGYGSMHQLALLPRNYFRKYPKWTIGYSDITAVHSAMASHGVMSIHGHMTEYLRDYQGADTLSSYLRQILTTGKIEYTLPSADKFNKPGCAKGILFGGNLSVLNDIAETPIDFLGKNFDNIILFLEDIGENIHSVSRILHRYKHAGILGKIKGLIIGDFHGYQPNEDYATMEEMIYDIVKNLNIPIAFNFPVGHTDDNYPLIQGCNAKLTVTPTTVTLEME